MHRYALVSIVLAAAVGLGRASAFDAKTLEDHLRESYNFPDRVGLTLGSPETSEVPGFDKVSVTLSMGRANQKETLYVSKDGRFYTLGGFKDLKANPDNERLQKMNLQDSPMRGKPKAAVEIVEYTDFQCPFCERGYKIMRNQIMKEFPSQVRWYYKSLPLKAIHPWAESAAVAAECAKTQSQQKFWTLHDAIFENQKDVRPANADEKLLSLARQAGVESKAFATCYDSKKTLPNIERDMSEAESLGINGTPAFLVNGHLIGGADYDQIKQIIQEALKGKHGRR